MHRNSKVVLILSFCLITTTVLAAGRCVPCKLNHYCVDGLRYQCPASTPVTQWTGTDSLDGCLTCVQRNGNSANPIYDDLVGDCVSCYEYDSSTPLWDGSACVACENGNTYNVQTGLCESSIVCPSGTSNQDGACKLTAATDACEAGFIAISTPMELAKIGVDANYPLNGSYCLWKDISLTAYGENYNNGEGWTPIGNSSNPFTGIFEGSGYSIDGLYINRPEADYQGLFASSTGTIKDFLIEGCAITGYSYVGSIVGSNFGTVENCTVSSGFIDAAGNSIGGIVGRNLGTIKDCRMDLRYIYVAGNSIGGIAGFSSGEILDSYISELYIVGLANSVGGVVGRCTETCQVIGCELEAGGVDIEASSCAGDIVGTCEKTSGSCARECVLDGVIIETATPGCITE